MTEQMQRFIELADIIALRFQCKCGAAVITPISGYKDIPDACPNCATEFVVPRSREVQETFSNIVRSLRLAQREAEGRGFVFSLEITASEVLPASRASGSKA